MRSLTTAMFIGSIGGFFGALATACTPYDPQLGVTPFLCGPSDPKCPAGFDCTGIDAASHPVCVATGQTAVDGGHVGFQCADDSMTEGPNRNDTVANAWQTPINAGFTTFPLAGLAICPDGDKDTYEVNITKEGQNLAALVEYQADGVALSVTILNAGGTAIKSGSPAGTDMVMASVTNLPTASSPYFVQVYGPATGKNNYKLTFTVTGP